MGRIPDEIVQQVIDRSDIVEVVSSYVPLKKAGRSFKALSPFNHEKTPSFFVSPDKQIFHCFSSGTGGNVVSFVMKMEHMEFPEAIRFLAERAGIHIPDEKNEAPEKINLRQKIFEINTLARDYFYEILLTDKSAEVNEARQYLKDRGITLDTVKHFFVGYALDQWDGLIKYLRKKDIPLGLMEKAGLIIAREKDQGYYDRFRGRIIFPIADLQGKCRAFGARVLPKKNSEGEKETAKYINSPETLLYTKGQHLYGFDMARENIAANDEVVIVEGYTDCVIPFQNGISNIVASLGTALTVEQIRLLRRYTRNVTMLFDADVAGQLAMLRSLDILIE